MSMARVNRPAAEFVVDAFQLYFGHGSKKSPSIRIGQAFAEAKGGSEEKLTKTISKLPSSV